MPHFLYLSDVFCPWCYAFGPVMRRLAAEHPNLSVRVLGGDLVPQPTTLMEMEADFPNIRDFFIRLKNTSGQSVDGVLAALDAQRPLRMSSTDTAVLLTALKFLAPGHALSQMEVLQQALYAHGKDVLSAAVREEAALRWNVDPARLERALNDPDIRREAAKGAREASARMGEFKLYPTLYLEKNGERSLLTRGYAAYAAVSARLEAALAGQNGECASGASCASDGNCGKSNGVAHNGARSTDG